MLKSSKFKTIPNLNGPSLNLLRLVIVSASDRHLRNTSDFQVLDLTGLDLEGSGTGLLVIKMAQQLQLDGLMMKLCWRWSQVLEL